MSAIDAEFPEEPCQHLRRIEGVCLHASQVRVHLPIWEPVADLVRDMERQGCLADPGLSGDDGDRDSSIRPSTLSGD
jgi:hypothetical protein